ncbi:MAG TPA: hypothetical protein VJ596_03055 [Gemmatimonadaceae bacterium]|nr:hypothetical protein [Gemmatimonadaceae bacterium]
MAASAPAAWDSATAPPIDPSAVPLMSGLTLTSALHFPDGDRENLVRVLDVSPEGATYSWYFRQRQKTGEMMEHSFERFVRSNDHQSAPRFKDVFDRGDAPGQDAMTPA